jgi:hypothetical protein
MTEFLPSRAYRFVQCKSPEWFLKDSTKKAGIKFVLLILLFILFLLFLTIGVLFSILPVEQVKTALPSIVMAIVKGFLKTDSLNSPFFVLPVFLLLFLALHAYLKNLAIVVEEKGVTFQGFLFSNIGKHYAWQDFAQIRQSQDKALVFIDRFGRSIQIHFGKPETPPKRKFFSWSVSFSELREKRQNRPLRFFVGEGHTLSLSEVIEAFQGPITPLEEAEKKNIPALNRNPVVTDRTSHLALAATCLVLLAFALGSLTPYFLLDNWQKHACGWAGWLFCGLGYAFAWRCLEKEESREAAWLLSLSFAAPLWFLVTPAASLLPVWLGEEARQETFVLQDRHGRQQVWQSETNPDLSFTQEIPRERQAYKPGARREFTVHHGPLGLYAMPLAELRPL